MFRMSPIAQFILAVATISITAGVSPAAFQLRITSFSEKNEQNGEVLVTDQQKKSDNNSTVGAISIDRNVGDFGLSISASSASNQRARLGFKVSVTGTQCGYLLIELTDTDLSFNSAGTMRYQADAAISNDSGIEFAAFLSRSNQEFGKSALAAEYYFDVDSGMSSYVGESKHSALRHAGSMTLTTFFRYSGSGDSNSFQYEVADFANPEPTTVVSALCGLPVLLGYLRRRRLNTITNHRL